MKIEEIKYFNQMLESLFEGTYVVDLDRRIVFWNKGAELLSGFSAAEVVGSRCQDNLLNHVDRTGCALCIGICPLQMTMEDGVRREADIFLHHKDGHRVPVSVRTIPLYDRKKIIGAIEVFNQTQGQNDILHRAGKLDFFSQNNLEQLKLLALYDQLTRLPNRRYLENLLELRLFEYNTLAISFGILFIDLDDFSQINNTYGHPVGDELLRMVAATFVGAIRSADIIGRWGGEEFVGIFPAANDESLKMIAERIRVLIEQSRLRRDTFDICVTVSIGGTTVKPDDTVLSLLSRADQLMYRCKLSGKNCANVLS